MTSTIAQQETRGTSGEANDRTMRRRGCSTLAVAAGFHRGRRAVARHRRDSAPPASVSPWGEPMREPSLNLLALAYRCLYRGRHVPHGDARAERTDAPRARGRSHRDRRRRGRRCRSGSARPESGVVSHFARRHRATTGVARRGSAPRPECASTVAIISIPHTYSHVIEKRPCTKSLRSFGTTARSKRRSRSTRRPSAIRRC